MTIITASTAQKTAANERPLFIRAPTLSFLPEPTRSAVITVSAVSVTKKNATVDIPSVKVSPTAATADAEIQLEATVAVVTSPQSLANVRIKGRPKRIRRRSSLFGWISATGQLSTEGASYRAHRGRPDLYPHRHICLIQQRHAFRLPNDCLNVRGHVRANA